MPYNGSGSYSAPASSWNPAVDGTDINSTDWAALLADIATAFSTCVLKDGSQTATALVPFAAGLSAGAAAAFNVNSSGVITSCAGATITSGNFTISAGTFSATGTAPHIISSGTATTETLDVFHTHASDPYGIRIGFSADPNNTTNYFARGTGNGVERWTLRTNGGLANYSANDVNLSTREVKYGCTIYSEDTLLKYESFLEHVDFGIWKYKDQTHDDWNHGPTVEGVLDALEIFGLKDEANSLIGKFAEGKLGLYTEDFKNIAIASLVASNKRLRERVATLEAA